MNQPAFYRSAGAMGIATAAVLSAPLVRGADEPAASQDLARAMRQFQEFYLGSTAIPEGNLMLRDDNERPPDEARALAEAKALQRDGSWSDIDYASPDRSSWPSATHGSRLLAMAAAAQRAGCPADERGVLLAATHRAFAFWIEHDFNCPNWWYNEIGMPKLLGTVGLLLSSELAETERSYLTGTMLPRSKIGRTGQNRVWLAGNALMLGLLARDAAIAGEAAGAIWSEVVVSTGEGIQPDFSFHQHGPQQQFGNYGLAFAVEISRWGNILRGTPWAMPPKRLAAFRGFLLEGENWVSWRGAMDISSCGRQFMPGILRTKTETIARAVKNVATFDGEFAPAYRAFIARNRPGAANDLIGNHFFWRSDYMIHRRPEFAATLKLSSKRVIGAESLNSENLSGYHLADGALYLYRTGDEYADIFPVWDWRKLPGVTCAQTTGPMPAFKESRIERDFVGGVSDGTRGCSALDYARDGVLARKAWFFNDDLIVCLGAGISSTGVDPVATTINQCLLRGRVTDRLPVLISPRDRRAAGSSIDDHGWIEHDGWRYVFPADEKRVHVHAGAQTGNWARVYQNPTTPPRDITQEVFTLWLDHGKNPQNASYVYAIMPASAGVAPDYTVIANQPALQAVRFGGQQAAVIFWEAGEIEIAPGQIIAADQPCLVQVDLASRRARVADPTAQKPEVALTLAGVRCVVKLPVDGEAGRSVKVEF